MTVGITKRFLFIVTSVQGRQDHPQSLKLSFRDKEAERASRSVSQYPALSLCFDNLCLLFDTSQKAPQVTARMNSSRCESGRVYISYLESLFGLRSVHGPASLSTSLFAQLLS